MSRYDQMKYVRCGNSGLLLPRMALGCWYSFAEFDSPENMSALLHQAFDLGITYFDLANNYGPQNGAAEINVGKILKSEFAGYRDELLIATKAGHQMWDGPYGDGGSRKYMLSSLDASLKRLQLDYVDIFYHHRFDPNTPLEETMFALKQAVDSGKTLYVGISKYPLDKAKEAIEIAKKIDLPLIVGQYKYSLLAQDFADSGVKKLITDEGLGSVVFSSLAQGLLTDKYLGGIPADSRMAKDNRFLKRETLSEELVIVLRQLNEIAASRSQTLAQMSLSWVLHQGAHTLIIGASKTQQIIDNAKALDNLDFTSEELDRIHLLLATLD